MPNAFAGSSNGGRFAAVRRGKSRLPIKAIFAAMPNQTMGQERGAARTAWQRNVDAELPSKLRYELQKQLYNETLPYSVPGDGGE